MHSEAKMCSLGQKKKSKENCGQKGSFIVHSINEQLSSWTPERHLTLRHNHVGTFYLAVPVLIFLHLVFQCLFSSISCFSHANIVHQDNPLCISQFKVPHWGHWDTRLSLYGCWCFLLFLPSSMWRGQRATAVVVPTVWLLPTLLHQWSLLYSGEEGRCRCHDGAAGGGTNLKP